tara:strand:- start:494 stop:694 length:201 start_codon:yes stop_codon:yes gene_type:complete
MIYLEPREVYDKAIIGQEGDLLIYSFWAIVEALMATGWTELEAIEHISYNIMGTSLPGWPIILEEK